MAAATIEFSSFISRQFIPTKGTSKHSIPTIPMRKSNLFQPLEIKMAPQTRSNKATKRKSFKLFVVPPRSPAFDTSSPSPAQTVMQFYSSINEKNLMQLDKLIAQDCCFEDYSFPKPFHGKKEVMHFLEQLSMCMGDYKNMRFNVELICEGNDSTVVVNWHLVWKKIQVPFTRGCSYFSLSENDDKLLIKKAQVLIESPIKLGFVALAIFKTVSSLFDAFPAATECMQAFPFPILNCYTHPTNTTSPAHAGFLKSPHTMFRLLLKAYNIGVQPVITPFLAWYIKLLNLTACILSTTLKILYYLAKIFHM
ncbi:uncharacterized protein LOC131024952 isoform X1 [Salvia miltiorrhiza]|uniref:uncharacterized protein LOC131024952 isoform X1 n=1 Tax=Salvia miltiorrhiza TaxID=226208 RepID=UPI0025AD17C0|nr:uncharacterized protein LOC131024952 isoform X1 [Salvia miltiorrhiza]